MKRYNLALFTHFHRICLRGWNNFVFSRVSCILCDIRTRRIYVTKKATRWRMSANLVRRAFSSHLARIRWSCTGDEQEALSFRHSTFPKVLRTVFFLSGSHLRSMPSFRFDCVNYLNCKLWSRIFSHSTNYYVRYVLWKYMRSVFACHFRISKNIWH